MSSVFLYSRKCEHKWKHTIQFIVIDLSDHIKLSDKTVSQIEETTLDLNQINFLLF